MNLRELERESIRAFVQAAADEGYLSGRVLDYGCGKQPYRDIVEAAGGEYFGYDSAHLPASVVSEEVGNPLYLVTLSTEKAVDTILCTQVLQYVPDVPGLLASLRYEPAAKVHPETRYLVLTYPTNWPEVEPEDLHRFTKAGMERLLTGAGFTIVRHERRAVVRTADFNAELQVTYFPDLLALGYGVIARA